MENAKIKDLLDRYEIAIRSHEQGAHPDSSMGTEEMEHYEAEAARLRAEIVSLIMGV